ncbi:AAA family ATPase [Actinomadura sp. WAC 06369]|uniref:AAA family ATPase n=1 Tax=Actinomadura sp. WAC 06369 TaxID=2203193 RepID=UPI000F79A22A|nr:ATP-binding protein [Actinomadura sp. WAC 06369]RSN48280.1 hypothetical protein DMH08_34470 [Actinomadura sp. WAC 06369]
MTPARTPSTVWLLAGLTGSGKTTFAKTLESRGVVRLSVDELVFARHGRYGVDYPEPDYPAKEAPVLAEVCRRMVELAASGHDVVLDHGLWRRADRDAAKAMVQAAGARWRLVYFDVDRTELARRLTERNRRADANALTVTESALDDFIARFEPLHGEGEEPPPPIA